MGGGGEASASEEQCDEAEIYPPLIPDEVPDNMHLYECCW